MSDPQFSDLDLSEATLKALADMGYERPTPVQASALPMVATGVDLMVQSQTGTGKTAAFGIPILERIDDEGRGIAALVLCPTRELARQVAEEFDQLTRYRRIQSVAVYGGASLEKQVAEMKFARVVVGTPGRILDHLRRRSLTLHKLRALILDEADEMLNMGFAQELNAIMEYVPTDRQTLLFSATIPPDIKRYAKRYMREPEFLSLIEENVGADDVEHHYYMVSGVGRFRDLVQVIEFEDPESAIIFTNTRKDSEIVARYLKRQGYDAEFLNGDMPQRDRERIMQLSKEKTLRFLVATDIAARGIDISELSHVINYILPESPEAYIHRTGRTGRAGNKGTAISLIGPREIGVYYYLKRIYNVALQERSVPTQAEIDLRREERRTDQLIEEIIGAVGPLRDPELRAQTMRLLERDEAIEVVQALLHAFRSGHGSGRGPSVRAGGLLSEIPQPDRIAPGSRAQTLEGVADRVAMVTSEYRGLPPSKRRPVTVEGADRVIAVSDPPPTDRAPTPDDGEDARPATPAASTPSSRPAPPPVMPASEPPPQAVAPTDQAQEREIAQAAADSPRQVDPAERPDPEVKRPNTGGTTAPPRRRRRTAPTEEQAAPSPTPALVASQDPPRSAAAEAPPTRPRPEPEPLPPVAAAAPLIAEPEAPEPANGGASFVDSRVFVNLGRRDGLEPEQLRSLLAELGGLLPEDILEVDLRSRHAFAIIVPEYVDDLILAANGETFGEQTVRVELAKDAR